MQHPDSRFTSYGLGLCLLAMTAGPAAAMIVSAEPAPPPSQDVLLARDSATDVGSYLCSHGSGTVIDLGQTFRLDRPAVLDKITLKARALTDVSGELMTLMLGTFSDPADLVMNEVLAIEIRGLPSALRVGETLYLTFDFQDLTLEAGRQYGFTLGFTGGGNVNDARLELLHVGDDSYGGGQAIAIEGQNPSALSSDLVFYLRGSTPGPGGDALLLHGGRFRVEATWRTPQGASGRGTPVALTDASGYFWFFGPDNVEVVLKVLDACVDPWNHYWVFTTGLTDVEVQLTVIDTVTGELWSHTNPMGERFAPIFDVEALSGCG